MSEYGDKQLARIADALERIADHMDAQAETEAWARYRDGEGPKPR